MTITATAELGTDTTPPRVRLDLDAGVGEEFETLTVYRDGRPLPRTLPPLGVRHTYAYDYEAALARPVTYSATGTTTAGAYDESTFVQVDEPGVWLIHPVTPGLSLQIDSPSKSGAFVTSEARRSVTKTIPRSTLRPPGRVHAVSYPMGPRQLPDWNLDLATPTLPLRDSLDALLADGAPLLLRVPFGYGGGTWDLPDGWYAVADAEEGRVGATSWRTHSLALTPHAEPPVRLAPAFTWGDLVARGMTWGDLLPHTWLDVLTGEV